MTDTTPSNQYPIIIETNIYQYDEHVFVWFDETGGVGGASNYVEGARDQLSRYAKSLEPQQPDDFVKQKLPKDARLAAECLQKTGSFETGQAILRDCADRIEELERTCAEWAETSQRNYVRAKSYYAALQLIAAPQYGLQSISEDYDIDSLEYEQACNRYYAGMVRRFQTLARSAINGEKE
jgi:hypothetical protein